MSQFDAVVFDVGRVLIDYDYSSFFTLMRNHGADIVGEFDFTARIDLGSYEEGGLSTEEFFAGLRRMLKQPIDNDTLIAAWTSIFTPIPEMLTLAQELKKHCKVYLLSNISPLHWDYLKQNYELQHLCHDMLGSYEAGAMKPHADIYAEAKTRFCIDPQRTVFVDDKPENISGARACGWKGFVHESSEQTVQQLRQLFHLHD
jgi:HAD superfamily hydrolase (TIGR01509 family)